MTLTTTKSEFGSYVPRAERHAKLEQRIAELFDFLERETDCCERAQIVRELVGIASVRVPRVLKAISDLIGEHPEDAIELHGAYASLDDLDAFERQIASASSVRDISIGGMLLAVDLFARAERAVPQQLRDAWLVRIEANLTNYHPDFTKPHSELWLKGLLDAHGSLRGRQLSATLWEQVENWHDTWQQETKPAFSRNASCFCGSGKKYKRCHWVPETKSRNPIARPHFAERWLAEWMRGVASSEEVRE